MKKKEASKAPKTAQPTNEQKKLGSVVINLEGTIDSDAPAGVSDIVVKGLHLFKNIDVRVKVMEEKMTVIDGDLGGSSPSVATIAIGKQGVFDPELNANSHTFTITGTNLPTSGSFNITEMTANPPGQGETAEPAQTTPITATINSGSTSTLMTATASLTGTLVDGSYEVTTDIDNTEHDSPVS